MSFSSNHTINPTNYEEWFMLYMDNELSTEERVLVEHFLLLHPHLQEEMEILQSTKLPVDAIAFPGKEELHADAMKLNAVDEALLLYLDNELSPAEKEAVEKKIAADRDYHLQYAVLQQTKLDAADIVPYPAKKEL